MTEHNDEAPKIEPTVTKPKPLILLEHLLRGGTVQFDGRTLAMDEDGNVIMRVVALSFGGGKMEPMEQWMIVDFPLASFIQLAENLDPEEILLMSAGNVLNRLKKGQNR